MDASFARASPAFSLSEIRVPRSNRTFEIRASGLPASTARPGLIVKESISPSIGAVRSVTGALTSALSDWSATMGGTTAFINKSESTLATTSEETRRITGWRRARETGSDLVAELPSTVENIAGSSWIGGVSRERSLQKFCYCC